MARNGPSLGQIRQYVVAALQADATVTALVGSRVYDNRCLEPQPVSYTHLTLPTIYSV